MPFEEMENILSQVKGAIASLEAQRAILGDAVVDASLAALQEKLADLEAQAHPPEQQRKLLTILFTDVVGSTQISRQFDPEELLDFMDPALKHLAKPVEEHGGRVTRFQGDGFKAIFGLPVARENDPEMAVRAGLGILEASREIAKELEQARGIPGFQVRVGINTGLVASGGLTEGEDTIGGETVNLAARLESAAPPGGLLISHNTYRHVRGIFNVEKAEPVRAKGFPEPIPVYLVKGAKPRAFRVQSRGVEGVETRMVGRVAELKLLQDALLTAMEDSEGQVVTVLGEAGVGKSRLLYEFQNWIELLPQPVSLYPARARPETQNLPYALLRDLFAYRFQIQEGDSVEVVRKKFEGGIREAFQVSTASADRQEIRSHELGQLAGGWQSGAHLLGQLLGVDFSVSPHLKGLLENAEAIRNRALESLVVYFSGVCSHDPVVIFLEDIHWADDSSLDAFNLLGRRGQNLRLIIVGLARPSLLELRPHWGEGQLYHRKINLEPLTKRESRQLVDEILQKIEQVPALLRELVVNGAEGNPFYIEELVKMLIEQGVIVKGEEGWSVQSERLEHIDVPSTLTGVLQARLDGLPSEERTVLQQASVVGRVFWDRLVAHLHSRQNGEGKEISPMLAGLRDKEMIFRREESVFAEALEYIFKHEVLREVTYETVLKKLRRLYHGWVADWLIEQGVKTGEEYSGLIAGQLERAGRIEQARDYLRRAGEAALAGYANAEAERFFRRAFELDPPDVDRPRLLEGLAAALFRLGYHRKAIDALREGINLYQAQGNPEGVARFYTIIVADLVPVWPAEAVRWSEIGLAAVEGLQDSRALGHLIHQSARAYMILGQFERARPMCLRALEIAERLGDLSLEADGLATMGILCKEPDEAIQTLHRAVELAEEYDFLAIAIRAHNNLSVQFQRLRSDLRSSLIHMHRAVEINRILRSSNFLSIDLGNLIATYLTLGDISAAEHALKELEQLRQEMPQPELMAGKDKLAKSRIASLRGQLETAFEMLTDFLAETRRESRLEQFCQSAIYSYVPLILDLHRYQDRADWSSAEEVLQEVVVLADSSSWQNYNVAAEAMFSAVFSRQRRIEEARQRMQHAQGQLPANPLAHWHFPVLIAEVELSIAEKRWADAISHNSSLLNRFTRAGMHWNVAHTLLEMAEIHRMRSQGEDREEAIDLYNQARELFAEIGATGYVEIVDGRIKMLQASKGS